MKKAIIFSIILSFGLIYPQQLTNWIFYTNMKNVKDLEADAAGFWSATEGGAFYYNAEKDSFNALSRNDGLIGISLTSLCTDSEGKIWFGGNGGSIDIYDPSQNSVRSILDIQNSDKTLKGINSLYASGDTIIAATDFGISLLDAQNSTFFDTFTKLGTIPSNYRINSAVKFDLIYACTDQGIAVQKKGAPNLSTPESWEVFGISEGLHSLKVFKVIKFQSSILAATDAGISILNGSVWLDFLPVLSSSVSDMEVSGDSLFLLSQNRIYLYFNGSLNEIYASSADLLSIEYSPILGIMASTKEGALRISNGNYLYPNGPNANKFVGLAVDGENNLWVASGQDPRGEGFFKYDGNLWLNYNTSNTPGLPSNNYFVAYVAPDNTKYFGNWGRGFVRLRNNQITIFTANNTDLLGVEGDPEYIVISGFASDSRNNLWILNSYAWSRKPLSLLMSDSTWLHYENPAAPNQYLGRQHYLAIDPYDTKWFASQERNKEGLFYFNENKTYDDLTDDESGFLTSSDGLTDDFITAVVTDLRGDIWVGTGFGVNIISNQQSILTGTPNLSITTVFSLRQQSINCIAVDPLNQKWIGTNQGLHVVNSDGSRLIASYNTENTILPTNEIKSIAIDGKNGRIYIGTDLGLISFDTPSIEPKESYSELLLYPNPYILNGNGTQLKIRNLIRDSEVKILTLTGKLVKYLEAETESSPGGDVAFWDGTDSEGNLVSSGVYFVVAFDKEGNNVISGKIAVIKE
jgi:ligand-binding sensor domain-containing protein